MKKKQQAEEQQDDQKPFDVELPVVEERKAWRTIASLSELSMLFATGQPVYKAVGLEKQEVSQQELYKVSFGDVIKMIKEYKLYR